MEATVVITTKDRKEELRRALLSCRTQSLMPEVLVLDDASSDGTAEMVREEFPEVRLERVEEPTGYIVQRNRGARLAKGKVVFSIDDDAEFSHPDVIARTLADFNGCPEVGAVAIPYIEPNKANTLLQKAPDDERIWQTSNYIGTAHAVRRDLFLELGGYREHLIHQGEESDFCIRLLDSGYLVRYGNSPPIVHHESPKRDFSRMDFYGARNSVLFIWENVPFAYLPFHLVVTTLRCLAWSLKPERLHVRARGLSDAWCRFSSTRRNPVGSSTYRQFRALRKRGPLPLKN